MNILYIAIDVGEKSLNDLVIILYIELIEEGVWVTRGGYHHMNILYKVTAKLEICYNDILCSNLAYILEERTAVILSFPIWRVYWQHI